MSFIDVDNTVVKPILFNNKEIKHGQNVYAIGNSLNQGLSITSGIISNPLVIINIDNIFIKAIVANIVITEGNSGGALIDSQGALIGITTFLFKDLEYNNIYGISYSIPVSTILGFN